MKKYIPFILVLLSLQFIYGEASAQVSDTLTQTLTQTQTLTLTTQTPQTLQTPQTPQTPEAPKKDGFFKKVIGMVFNPKIKYDTNYVAEPYGKFLISINQNFSQHNYYTTSNGESLAMKNGLTVTTGLNFSYKGVGFGYSLNFKKLSKKTTDMDMYFNLYNSSFGIDIHIFNVHNLYYPTIDYAMENGQIKGFNINAYYVLNNKKFSYPAPFSFSKVQKKTAGSVIFGLSYYNDKLNYGIGEDEIKELLSVYSDASNNKIETANRFDTTFTISNFFISQFKTQYVSLGVGYALNVVICKGLLFHISLEPSLLPWQSIKVTSDSPTIKIEYDDEEHINFSLTNYETNEYKIPYYFWNFGCNGRASLSYSWKRFYVTANYLSTMSYMKIPEIENVVFGRNALIYRWWSAKLSVGFRF